MVERGAATFERGAVVVGREVVVEEVSLVVMGRWMVDMVVEGREDGFESVVETPEGLTTVFDEGTDAEDLMLVLEVEEGSRELSEEGLVVESPFRGAKAVVRREEVAADTRAEVEGVSFDRGRALEVEGTEGFLAAVIGCREAEDEEAVARTPLVRMGARRGTAAGVGVGVTVDEALGVILAFFGSPRSNSSSESRK